MAPRAPRQTPEIPDAPQNLGGKMLLGGIGGLVYSGLSNAGMFIDNAAPREMQQAMMEDIQKNPTNPLVAAGVGASIAVGHHIYKHVKRYKALNDHFGEGHQNSRL